MKKRGGFQVDGKEVSSAAGEHKCGPSAFQQSLDTSKATSLSFSADIAGSDKGGFAYSYYVENKQLP